MRIKTTSLLFATAVVAIASGCSDDDDAPMGRGGTGMVAGHGGNSGRGGIGGCGPGASGKCGNPFAGAGHGGATAGTGGAGAGQGGSTGGNGGSGGDGCPVAIVFAEGDPCSPEGKICDDGGTNPCEFGNAIECIEGVWVRSESFPDPNCGGAGGEAGGAGSDGSSGARQ